MDNLPVNQNEAWGKDVFPLLSWFKIDKVKNAKVIVAGCGALGNEVLKNLALFGVGNIIVIDYDQIEYSNLTRSILFRPEDADKGFYKAEIAAKRVREINPTVNIQAICGDLATGTGLGVYRRAGVVIGCLDSLIARVLLNRQCFRAGKIWIEGGIGDLEGQVTGYQLNKNCYECGLSDEEQADINATLSCPGIARENEKSGRVATTPVSASIIAAIQVQEAMKIIHKEETEAGLFTSLIGDIFHYEGAHPNASTFEFATYYDDCPSHEFWENVVEIPQLSAGTPVAESLEIIKKQLNVKSVEINLRNDKFVDKIVSRAGNKKFMPMLPESRIADYIEASQELTYLSATEGGLYQNAFENIDEEFPYLDLTLNQIGIPYFDVLQVTTEKGYAYVELSKDKERYSIFL